MSRFWQETTPIPPPTSSTTAFGAMTTRCSTTTRIWERLRSSGIWARPTVAQTSIPTAFGTGAAIRFLSRFKNPEFPPTETTRWISSQWGSVCAGMRKISGIPLQTKPPAKSFGHRKQAGWEKPTTTARTIRSCMPVCMPMKAFPLIGSIRFTGRQTSGEM